MADIFEIAGRIHSTSQEKVVTTADEILDGTKKQSQINTETYGHVESIDNAIANLSPEQQGAVGVAAKANNNESKIGYYVCDTAASVAAKAITAANYILSVGGSIKIKFEHANSAASGVTLKIGSAEAKSLYYDGVAVSATNTWEDNEVVEVYYDGTNYYANNVAGGSSDGVFDITAKTGDSYATLSNALTAANTVIPANKKKGGMSIKYVQSSDNKYVQYRFLLSMFTDAQFANSANWQEINNNIELVLQNHAELSTKEVVPFADHVTGKYYDETGEHDNQYYFYNKYAVQPNTVYFFSSKFFEHTNISFIYWYDENNHFIDKSQYGYATTDPIVLENQAILSPAGAAFAYMNCATDYTSNIQFYKTNDYIPSHLLKTNIDRDIAQQLKISNTAIGCIIISTAQTNGIINDKGNSVSKSGFQNWKYNVTPFTVYSFSGKYSANSVPVIVSWYNSDDSLIFQEPYKAGTSETQFNNQIIIAPAEAAYMRLNVETQYSSLAIAKRIKYNSDEMLNFSGKTFISPLMERRGYFYYNNGERANQYQSYKKFKVEAGKTYCFNSVLELVSIPFLYWLDTNNNIITSELKGDISSVVEMRNKIIIAPDNASYLCVNCDLDYVGMRILYEVTDTIKSEPLEDKTNDNTTALSEKILLEPISKNDGFVYFAGEIRSNQYFQYWIYNVTVGKQYVFSGFLGTESGIFYIHWFDENSNWIGSEPYRGNDLPIQPLQNITIVAPTGAAFAYVNVFKEDSHLYSFSEVGETIQSSDMKKDISDMKKDIEMLQGKTKVVINIISRPVSDTIFNNVDWTTAFYVRARYNADKDIIIEHCYNGNQLITFSRTFIGANSMTDEQIMVDANIVSTHRDSTAPMNQSVQYWHLFAQHGVPVPTITNNVGMTSSDVGAEWKDQLERHYKVGYVTSSNIYLLPIIYQDANGHWVRDWKNKANSTAISSLTHVSGGTYTTAFTVSGYNQVQLRPVMMFKDRTFLVDGNEITETGTYYCDEFKVNETAIGYDPATITDWFGGAGHNVDLTGADPLAEFTFSYNYKGAQCCVNTTLHLLKEFQCSFYGAIQQQFFYDNGNYKAMFLVPKAKTIDGVVMDKPFNSPSNSSPSHYIYRTTNHLKNIDDPVDRQIGYLYDSNTDKYLVGMAAGLSLVSGDTITSKRIQNCLEGHSGDYRWVLLDFSPANINKFYIAAVNSSAFANDDYYFPAGYFKEINYYISYFDPAENVGQVYWYKDGSGYVIYAHCQSQQSALAINVPECMEGRSLTVVEKTTDAELLTDTIQNGKFFVNYNSDDANYIVLKAE